MSDRTYLLASSHAETAGPTADGGSNYDDRAEGVAEGGSYQLPMFWLSLFGEAHICLHQFGEYRVPTVVCDRATAVSNLGQRRAAVLAAFPAWEMHWNAWERLVRSRSAPYWKMDAAEFGVDDPETFEADLRSAVRWFASGDAGDFKKLLELGALYYDGAAGRFKVVGDREVAGEHLYGYPTAPNPPAEPPPLPQQPPPLPQNR